MGVGASGPRARRVVAGGLALLVGAALVWALAGKVIPALFPDGERVARLRNPVDYWNALALVAAWGVPLGLWLAARRRAIGAVLVYLAEVAVVLTLSRAGIAVAAVAAVAWVALTRERLASMVAIVVATVPAGVVLGFALARPALVDDLQPHADRVRDGAIFGALLCLGAAVVGWAAAAAARRSVDDERLWTRRLGIALGAVAIAGVVAVAAAKGGAIADEFRSHPRGEPVDDAARRAEHEQPLGVVAGGVDAVRAEAARRQGAGASSWRGRRCARARR